MSFNPSRGDKSDSQYRKTGGSGGGNRSGNNASNSSYQRSHSGKSSTGGGGGPALPGSLQSNRSFKKSNNVQVGQSRGNTQSVPLESSNVVAPPCGAPNGVLPQVPAALSQGVTNVPVSMVATKFAESRSAPSSNPAGPKVYSSQAASVNPKMMQTPPKPEGVQPKGFALQFGSISPGLVNGVQIPPRTSSAPPNLDEQKLDQLRWDSSRPMPTVAPIPSVPKQKLPMKEPSAVTHSVVVEPPITLHPKKETHGSSQVPSALPLNPGMSMQVPYYQQHGLVQFGVSPQVQPQRMPSPSLQMPPLLNTRNSPLLSQPMFVPSIPHLIQHHGMMHQGPGINFTNQLGSQMPHQMGNMGHNLGQQFTPPQAGKFSFPRTTIKITHPDTHEELRLDRRGDPPADGGTSKAVIQTNIPPQPQPVLSFRSAHPSNLYQPPSKVADSSIVESKSSVVVSAAVPAEGSSFPPTKSAPTSAGSTTSINTKNGGRMESLSRSNSIKGQAKMPSNVGDNQPQHQMGSECVSSMVGGQDTASMMVASGTRDGNIVVANSQTPEAIPIAACPANPVRLDIPGKPKHGAPVNSLSNESMGTEEHQKNQVAEKASAVMNEEFDEKLTGLEKSSTSSIIIQNELEGQRTLKASKELESSKISEGASIHSANYTETAMNCDEANPAITVQESKNATSLEESALKCVDILNSSGSRSEERLPVELNRPKSATSKGKKKSKEIMKKADAAGTTSDLYMAYKGPEEKEAEKEHVLSSESSSNIVDVKQIPADAKEKTISTEAETQVKSEPDNWEDDVDIATQKMEVSHKSSSGGLSNDDNEIKKYTRDFLMKFNDICDVISKYTHIPREIISSPSPNNLVRDPHPSSGRGSDRSTRGARSERRENVPMDADKWNKGSASFPSRDQRADFSFGNSPGGFKQGAGGNAGVLRNPRGDPGQHSGGILSGHLQSVNSFQRDNADADRWQRSANFQKGLIPSPQAPSQMMHKAEKKYEIGKVADEEEAKQRQLKGILNKLTPQNFERLFEKVKAVNIDNAGTLTGVISQIFDKALMEPTFCEMYADFCYHLSGALPDFTEDNHKITFKIVLLNKCQEEFERGEREQEEANRAEEEGEVAQLDEEREEKRVQARRRMLGNIRLIGELYKKRMLTEKIMHECIRKLLGQYQNSDEEDIEALCKLMSTIGETIDHPKAKEHMDAYFEMMLALSNNMKFSSRVRFMLKDSIDLRKNNWQQRRKVEGPKKIDDVHRDAAHERQAQSSRLTRGPSMNSSSRRGPSTDFVSRGSSNLVSPSSQTGGFRSFPTQVRGFGGAQDVRMEERQPPFESRNVSVPLPQRSAGNDTITLGPQGGLARGMSITGAPPAQMAPPVTGSNGYRPANERQAYNSNDDALPRYASGRLVVSAHEQPAGSNRHSSFNREVRSSDCIVNRPNAIVQPTNSWSLSEEQLRNKSLAAIKEYYSAQDEKEVALCMKNLNSPSFYPTMISLWVLDSFERKDMERDLLGRLLVNLTKPHDMMLTRNDMLKGFEYVLAALEDAVNDAPRAPEFLGSIFAKIAIESVLSLGDIGQIIQKGGEEPGSLVEFGLAGDVLGSVLEMIQTAKGVSYLQEIRSSSNLRLEDFNPMKSNKLEKFM